MVKYCVALLLLCSALPSLAEALPYTRYDLNSPIFNGYAIFNNVPTMYTEPAYPGDPYSSFPYVVSETFLIPKFYLTSSTGDIYVGSGYLELADLSGQANDSWYLASQPSSTGGHSYFSQASPTGGNCSVSQELYHSPNGLPTTLPDSFYFIGHGCTYSGSREYSWFDIGGELHLSNPEAISAVPEPGTCMLLAAGLCCLIFVSKRRQVAV